MGLPQSISKAIKSTCYFAQRSLAPATENIPGMSLVKKDLEDNESPVIPQASVQEKVIVRLENQDWRRFFSYHLSGLGLEIGPLHRPMVTHKSMQVHYVDRFSVADLREHYPELREFSLVEPHILDDAETLSSVKDASYDFLIAAHVIEHMKNPISSLEQWCRVVKPGGLIYMIVPDKRKTFDKHRVRTNVPHIVLDYLEPSSERDFEHYLDYGMHVHGMNNPDDALKEANRLLEIDYSIHFHVFMPEDVVALLNWFSTHVRPLEIIEGPHMTPGSDEFHFLLSVGNSH
jgi:predicted SAM-dependent methyltransferase